MTRLGVRAPGARPWRVAASRSHADARTEAFIRNLGPSERISIGSSLKFCLLAEGGVDIYPRFGPTCEWDTAAAQCVVEQAGGRVTDVGLEPLRYNTGESLLNPYFLAFGDRGRGLARVSARWDRPIRAGDLTRTCSRNRGQGASQAREIAL